MRRLTVMVWAGVLMAGPVRAQSDELATLRAELLEQQQTVAELIKKIEELERKQAEAATQADLEEEARIQQDSVTSLRENLLGRVNLTGYYNFRYFNDDSPAVSAFQQHNLGVLLGKQISRFNFFMELELQNIPHHREFRSLEGLSQLSGNGHSEEGEEGEEQVEPDVHVETGEDISGEGQVAVENAWMEYNHNRYLNVRVGKQLSPQFWWQNHYPNLTFSTDLPIYLR